MNNAELVGRLTKDPELRKSTSGISVCSFTLAVDRPIKKSEQDNGQQTADFIQCVAWRGTAEYLCNYGEKGSRVGVSGRIQTRNYDRQDGTKVYVTEVVANSVEVYGSGSKSSGYSYKGNSVKAEDIDKRIANDPGDPFNQQAQQPQQSRPRYQQQTADSMNWGYGSQNNQDDQTDISSDDLPF